MRQRDRAQGFSEQLARSGRSCGFFQQPDIYKTGFRLTSNTAIFTFNLSVARLLIEELAERMIAVPEEVAVLGVDKEPFLQRISPVPISSIALNSEKIGYEAAGLLKRMDERDIRRYRLVNLGRVETAAIPVNGRRRGSILCAGKQGSVAIALPPHATGGCAVAGSGGIGLDRSRSSRRKCPFGHWSRSRCR